MTRTPDRFRLHVYVRDRTQADLARALLGRVEPDSVKSSEGLVMGVASRAELDEAMERGLLVDVEPLDNAPLRHPAPNDADSLEELHAHAMRLQRFLREGEDTKLKHDLSGLGANLLVRADDILSPENLLRRRGLITAEMLEFRDRVADETEDEAKDAAPLAEVGFVPADARLAPRSEVRAALSRGSAEEVYELRIDLPMNAEFRRALAEVGVELLSYRAPSTYRYALTPQQLERVRALPFVTEVEWYGPERTVGDDVVEALGGEEAAPEPRTFDLTVHRAADLDAVRAAIQAEPGNLIVDASGVSLRFRSEAGTAFLSRLARRSEVAKLHLYHPPELRADISREVMGVNAVSPIPPAVPLDGTGEVVALFDSGTDASHPDLQQRLAVHQGYGRGSADDVSGHGTHVAGIIAGDGSVPGSQVRGIAPGVKLVSVGIAYGARPELDTPADLGTLLDLAVAGGAHVVNLSWGTPLGARYEQGALSVDRWVCAHPDVLVVVAAGNSGAAPTGVRRLGQVGTPATAKNVLTVGATLGARPQFADRLWSSRFSQFADPEGQGPMSGDPQIVAAISSTGPAQDTMVKPDVVAPGTFILSARARNAAPGLVWADNPEPAGADQRQWYCFSSGTSMAAPAVSGAAALVRQYLRGPGRQPTPSAALLKAVLVASAQPVASPRSPAAQARIGFPDFDQGFGRVDLRNVLPHPGAPPGRRLLTADVLSGQPGALVSGGAGPLEPAQRVYVVRVLPGATASLRVVLTWTDPPGPSVHNKLRLSVTGPGKVLGIGNAGHVFGRNELMAELAPGSQTFDRFNTVESVLIESPPAGIYYIRVFAHNTPTPPQGYALVVSGELHEEALS